jgi:hypothetical protein
VDRREVEFGVGPRRVQRLDVVAAAVKAQPGWRRIRVRVAALREFRPIADHLIRELLLGSVKRRWRQVKTQSRRVRGWEQILDFGGESGPVREAYRRIIVLRRVFVVKLVGVGRDETRRKLVYEMGRAGVAAIGS